MTEKLSNKSLPCDPKMFPPPATWMSWIRNVGWEARVDADGNPVKHTIYYDKGEKSYDRVVYDHPQKDDGTIRHHYTRAEARKSLLYLGKDSAQRPADQRGRFYCDWAVFEWVNGEWVLRGGGLQGELRKTNDFFAKKQTKDERAHPIDQALEAAAIESILQAAS